jgi:hypothetical protein
MKAIKGLALFLAWFAGDSAAFDAWDDSPHLGRPAVRPGQSGEQQDLLRRMERAGGG